MRLYDPRYLHIILIVFLIISIVPIQAIGQDEGIHITSYELYYYEGPKVETTYLLAGKVYKAELTIEMGPKTPPGVNVVVETDLASYRGGEIFVVKEANVNYTVKDKLVVFTAKPGGKMVLSIVGEIPDNVTIKVVDGVELHYKVVLSIVKMYYENNPTTPIAQKTYEVIDEVIEEFYKTLNEKQKLAQIPEADETWKTMVSSLVSLADKLASKGLVVESLNLLKSIPDEPVMKPPESKDTLYFVIMGVVALVMVVAIVMWIRATGKSKFLEEKLESIVGDLEAISVRVEKLDKRVASELREIIDRVKASLT